MRRCARRPGSSRSLHRRTNAVRRAVQRVPLPELGTGHALRSVITRAVTRHFTAFSAGIGGARYEPIELPEDIHELIDLTAEQLQTLEEEDNEGEDNRDGNINGDFIFDAIPNLRLPETNTDLDPETQIWEEDEIEDSAEDLQDSDDDQEVPAISLRRSKRMGHMSSRETS